MVEAPENGNESSHSAHANGMNEMLCDCVGTVVHLVEICLANEWISFVSTNSGL